MTGPMPFAQLDDRARRMLPLVLAGPYVLLGALALFTAGIKHAAGGPWASTWPCAAWRRRGCCGCSRCIPRGGSARG
jgi:hypothetical protein